MKLKASSENNNQRRLKYAMTEAGREMTQISSMWARNRLNGKSLIEGNRGI